MNVRETLQALSYESFLVNYEDAYVDMIRGDRS